MFKLRDWFLMFTPAVIILVVGLVAPAFAGEACGDRQTVADIRDMFSESGGGVGTGDAPPPEKVYAFVKAAGGSPEQAAEAAESAVTAILAHKAQHRGTVLLGFVDADGCYIGGAVAPLVLLLRFFKPDELPVPEKIGARS